MLTDKCMTYSTSNGCTRLYCMHKNIIINQIKPNLYTTSLTENSVSHALVTTTTSKHNRQTPLSTTEEFYGTLKLQRLKYVASTCVHEIKPIWLMSHKVSNASKNQDKLRVSSLLHQPFNNSFIVLHQNIRF